ncbi:hypothetical protein [Nannocystis pusilla]|uniref:hypothetical protein n=1 Tax=Nannocystis pusilla TaxID=889268 RepID=UPI003DA516A6
MPACARPGVYVPRQTHDCDAAVLVRRHSPTSSRASRRAAIERYGLPRTYYVDRGAAYVADSLRVICAELGIRLVHTSPGDCEAEGAIERWRRTWRDGLEHELPDTLSLPELNRRHWAWIAERYHRRQHATTGHAPLMHMLADREHLRPAPGESELNAVFLHRERRKVRGDGTVRWLGGYLEVPYALAGQQTLGDGDSRAPPPKLERARFAVTIAADGAVTSKLVEGKPALVEGQNLGRWLDARGVVLARSE